MVGQTALLAFSGALDHPRDMPLSIPLQPRFARYIRLTQTGSDTIYYWSIAELQMLGMAPPAGSPAQSR